MPDIGLYEAIELYKRWGLAILPIAHRSKKPLVDWKPLQRRKADNAELGKWFGNEHHKNIGIVCGRVSGNLVVLDFDKLAAFQEFGGKWKELRGTDVQEETPVVKTGRGFQVYLRIRQIVNKRRLTGRLDIQGEGSYIVAPPSIHPSGAVYQFMNPQVTEILQIHSLVDLGVELPEGPVGDKQANYQTNHNEVTEIAQLVAPHWKQDYRHELALSLSAYLAKLGWALPMVKEVIKRASKDDNEPKDRLRAIEDTFAKIKGNQPVRGFKGLEEILPKATLDRVELLAKNARVSPLIRKVDEIRLSKGQTFLKKRHIAEVVNDELNERGKFLRTPGDELFYFNGSVIPLDAPDFKALIERQFGLNPTETEGRYALSSLENEALTEGKKVEVYRLTHWDRASGILYIDMGDGETLKLDGKTIKRASNGDDGVYFAREKWQQPFKPDLEKAISPWAYLTDDLNFEIGELVALRPEQQREVAKFWVLSLFFTEELPTKPILCLTGDAGSGKSLFLRRLLHFLYGNGDLDTIRGQDDFWASLSANHLLALDDLESDKTPKWVIPELKRAATGQTISLRKLYTTNTQVSFTPRCFVAFTSINPPIDDSALAERLIILRLKKRPSKTPESKLLRMVKGLRDRMWDGLILELNALIPKLLEPPPDSTFRMADWASLIERIEGRDKVEPLLQGLTTFQDEALLEDSPLPAIIEEWQSGKDVWLTPAQLYGEWSTLSQEGGLYFPFKNARSLAMHLTNVRHNLARVFGLDWEKSIKRGSKVVYRFSK